MALKLSFPRAIIAQFGKIQKIVFLVILSKKVFLNKVRSFGFK
jgi:hypothetical protein